MNPLCLSLDPMALGAACCGIHGVGGAVGETAGVAQGAVDGEYPEGVGRGPGTGVFYAFVANGAIVVHLLHVAGGAVAIHGRSPGPPVGLWACVFVAFETRIFFVAHGAVAAVPGCV